MNDIDALKKARVQLSDGGKKSRHHEPPSAFLDAETQKAFAGLFLYHPRLKASRRIHKITAGDLNPLRGPAKLLRDCKRGNATLEEAIELVIAPQMEYARRLWSGEEEIA